MKLQAIAAFLPTAALWPTGQAEGKAGPTPCAGGALPKARPAQDELRISGEAQRMASARCGTGFDPMDLLRQRIIEQVKDMEKPSNSAAEVRAIGAQMQGSMTEAVFKAKQEELEQSQATVRAENERELNRIAQDQLLLSAAVIALRVAA